MRIEARLLGRDLKPHDQFKYWYLHVWAWDKNPGQNYHRQIDNVVTAIGLDPAEVTIYCLRHSSIVRMLLRNVPIRLVASLHNTSVAMIEKHYSKYITEHSIDDIARIGLLSEPAPAADNVVALVR